MSSIKIYKNLNDEECVIWKDELGTHSMLKSVYDNLQENIK